MKILMIGSGAVGGFVGARLIENGADVTFLVRPERRAQLLTRGLNLTSPFGRFRAPVHAVTANELAGIYDRVFVATRAQNYDAALALAAPVIAPQTLVVPLIEGVQHLDVSPYALGLRRVGAVFEGRVTIDADGVLHQRAPKAELHFGELKPLDKWLVSELVKLCSGRGLTTIHSNRIRAKTWERFAYQAAGIATGVLMNRPLRDAMRFALGAGNFETALREGHRVGVAARFAPDIVEVRKYENAFMLEGRPVQSPPLIDADGRAGDEAGYLLASMLASARHWRVPASTFESAWRTVAPQVGTRAKSDNEHA